MKLTLTENFLKNIIQETIKDYLNCGFYNDYIENRKFNLIEEGLVMTFEPKRVMKVISNKFDLDSIGCKLTWFNRTSPSHPINKQKGHNDIINSTRDYNQLIEIILSFPKGFTKANPQILNKIIKTFDVCGWMFASIQEMVNYKEFKNVDDCDYAQKYIPYKMYFRPKFDQVVNKNGIPNVCYHICPSRLVDKILRQGLKPKDLGRTSNHTERVFLFYKYPQDWKNNIADNFRQSRENEKYTLLKVNTGKWIKDVTQNNVRNDAPKFQFDSLTMSDDYPAIYTFEPIPSKYISVLETE